MMKHLKIILTFFLMSIAVLLSAQAEEDVIYLKNGSVIRGAIIEQTGEMIKVEIQGGSIFVFKMEEIDKVTRAEKKSRRKDTDFIYKNRGYFHTINLGILPGLDQFSNVTIGGSIRYNFGFLYNRFIGASVGTGFDTYINGWNNSTYGIIPVVLEAKGYLLDKPFTPYYSLSMGYGFALMNNSFGLTDARGGFNFQPKIGLRFASRSNASFFIEVGYTHQSAAYTYDDWQGLYEDRVKFNRTSIHFGFLF